VKEFLGRLSRQVCKNGLGPYEIKMVGRDFIFGVFTSVLLNTPIQSFLVAVGKMDLGLRKCGSNPTGGTPIAASIIEYP